MRAQQKPATNPQAIATNSTPPPAHHHSAGIDLI
jgi:hypothetical protein